MKIYLHTFILSLVLVVLFCSCQTSHQTIHFSESKHVKYTVYNNQPIEKEEYLYNKEVRATLSGFITLNDLQCKVYLIDWNQNGSFLDINQDYIGIEKLSRINRDYPIKQLLGDSNHIQINGQYLSLQIAEKSGGIWGELKLIQAEQFNRDSKLVFIDRMPGLIFQKLDQESITLENLQSKDKWIYLDFWATWCSPCIKQLRQLKENENEINPHVTIVTVAYESDPGSVAAFIEQNDLNNWIHTASNAEAERIFQIKSVSRSFLFDPDGKLVGVDVKPDELLVFTAK